MKTRQKVGVIAGTIFGAGISYLICAFIGNSFDPSNWYFTCFRYSGSGYDVISWKDFSSPRVAAVVGWIFLGSSGGWAGYYL